MLVAVGNGRAAQGLDRAAPASSSLRTRRSPPWRTLRAISRLCRRPPGPATPKAYFRAAIISDSSIADTSRPFGGTSAVTERKKGGSGGVARRRQVMRAWAPSLAQA